MIKNKNDLENSSVEHNSSGIKSVAIIVPCYNEELVLDETISVLSKLLGQWVEENLISPSSHIYFVDDGSSDKTWSLICGYASKTECVSGIRLSRNKGHQNALCAGLWTVQEDILVTIDADLQDDPTCIESMIREYYNGNDIVYGVRSERKTDSYFKRHSAESYYRLMSLWGVDLIFNHADFRLLSRRAVEALKEYPEANLFLRGIIREIGFRSTIVEYSRSERLAGNTKYPLRKMLSLAWGGITSFSSAPLRLITILGFLASSISLLIILWVFLVWAFSEETVPGWASILLPLLFIGSVQLFSLGVVGEYIAKLYRETKRRPKFHISDRI